MDVRQERIVLIGLRAELMQALREPTIEECREWFAWYNLGVWFVREGRDKKVWQGWKGANR
jgi:hypothetical protein